MSEREDIVVCAPIPRSPEFAARVLALVGRSAADGCWHWLGARFSSGYGRVNWRGADRRQTATSAHRVVWSLLYGEPSPDLEICHKCDNRLCCNPAHLFLGTPKDNGADRARKGRSARLRGTANGFCKLTESDVIAIRRSTLGHRSIARLYGVSERNIRLIRSREAWPHV